MRINPSKKLRLASIVAALVATCAFAAVALANITVYTNNFDRNSDYKQIRKADKKACDNSYREGAKKIRVDVGHGNHLCGLLPPVSGDSDVPDHDVRVQGKFIKKGTTKSQRKGAYVSLAVRVGAGQRYELTVKPRNKRFSLARIPNGSGFPVEGHLKEIKPFDKMNTLRLRAFGTRIRAFVNGQKVGSKREDNPGEVAGRRIVFGLGNSRPSKQPISGLMDNLRIQVPAP